MRRWLRLCAATLIMAATGVVIGAAPANADSGGGCWQPPSNYNAYVCISVRTGTTGPLIADYYINVTSRGEWRGITWIEQGGSFDGCYNDFQAGVWNYVGGHSPVYTRGKICHQARTVVQFYNVNGGFLYSATSPWMYW
jgi:hypothetical protein